MLTLGDLSSPDIKDPSKEENEQISAENIIEEDNDETLEDE